MKEWLVRIQVLCLISVTSSVIATYSYYYSANETDAIRFLTLSDYVNEAIDYSIWFGFFSILTLIVLVQIFGLSVAQEVGAKVADNVRGKNKTASLILNFVVYVLPVFVLIGLIAYLIYTGQNVWFHILIWSCLAGLFFAVWYGFGAAKRKFGGWNVTLFTIAVLSFSFAGWTGYVGATTKSTEAPPCRIKAAEFDRQAKVSPLNLGVIVEYDNSFTFVPWEQVKSVQCEKRDRLSAIKQLITIAMLSHSEEPSGAKKPPQPTKK